MLITWVNSIVKQGFPIGKDSAKKIVDDLNLVTPFKEDIITEDPKVPNTVPDNNISQNPQDNTNINSLVMKCDNPIYITIDTREFLEGYEICSS
ncbi:hypothetical protein FQA39_LY02746 [Lamprigera yunnana]|nr:hypothetical protein FQA39_LY02746 [Lamprigera yunnana]